MNDHAIDLVVFDIGGVLVRIARTWQEVFEQAGIREKPALTCDANRKHIIETNHQFETGRIDESKLVGMLCQLADRCEPADACDILDAWLIEPYDGIKELLEQIAATGVKTACLTNTNERHWRTMMHSDPRYIPIRRLDYRIASHVTGELKPDAAAYEIVEHQTGTSGNAIIMFDDSADNCAAARDQGWHAHQIDHTGDTVAQVTRHLRECGIL